MPGERLAYVAALAAGAALVFGDRPKRNTYARLAALPTLAELDAAFAWQARAPPARQSRVCPPPGRAAAQPRARSWPCVVGGRGSDQVVPCSPLAPPGCRGCAGGRATLRLRGRRPATCASAPSGAAAHYGVSQDCPRHGPSPCAVRKPAPATCAGGGQLPGPGVRACSSAAARLRRAPHPGGRARRRHGAHPMRRCRPGGGWGWLPRGPGPRQVRPWRRRTQAVRGRRDRGHPPAGGRGGVGGRAGCAAAGRRRRAHGSRCREPRRLGNRGGR